MTVCAQGCGAKRLYRHTEQWQHGEGCPSREVVRLRYIDMLMVVSDVPAQERMEAIRLHVIALGELIAAEDAVSGQGASVYASVTFAIRDTYADARAVHRAGR